MQTSAVLNTVSTHVRTTAVAWHALGMLVFGLIMVYCVGFSSITRAHNTAHDTRHASGFPFHQRCGKSVTKTDGGGVWGRRNCRARSICPPVLHGCSTDSVCGNLRNSCAPSSFPRHEGGRRMAPRGGMAAFFPHSAHHSAHKYWLRSNPLRVDGS
jgi:cobalt transporter subunit CbtB